MQRLLVLFARGPGREACAKGFAPGGGTAFFEGFARGWLEAAHRAGARLVVATPAEDRGAWQRLLGAEAPVLFLDQQGRSFGERLERAARQAFSFGGRVIVTGGDVVPCGLDAPFERLERGDDAVLAPSEDGGVSLVGLGPEDFDLLGAIAPRRRDVFGSLLRGLAGRGRLVAVVPSVPDVDGRRGARALYRLRGRLTWLVPLLRGLLADARPARPAPATRPGARRFFDTPVLRGPPLPA